MYGIVVSRRRQAGAPRGHTRLSQRWYRLSAGGRRRRARVSLRSLLRCVIHRPCCTAPNPTRTKSPPQRRLVTDVSPKHYGNCVAVLIAFRPSDRRDIGTSVSLSEER